MGNVGDIEIVLVSSGHQALDHRVYDKEALSLARYYDRVRVVAAHEGPAPDSPVRITALKPVTSRLERFLFRPLECYFAARGKGRRLLIVHDAELAFWAPLVKMVTGWHIIYDVHEDFAQLILRRPWLPSRIRRAVSRGISLAEKVCARACDGVVGVTWVLAEYFPHPRRTAIFNLPSREFIELAGQVSRPIDEREFDVVHLGTLSEERLNFLCEVLDWLFTSRPETRALILGVRDDQEALLRRRYPSERAVVKGKVPYQCVPDFLGNCRVGINIHPVLYPHLRCAVPVKVFEYMAAGCNVVTSYLPELRRLLGDDGGAHVPTVSVPSASRFAEEVERLLESPESIARHQQELLYLVNTRWNWDAEAEKLQQFVAGILDRKERAPSGEVLNH